LTLPRLKALELIEQASAFDHPDFIFEPKYDGFRALAYIENSKCELVSRTGVTYKRFADLRATLPNDFRCDDAIVDGELVVLDDQGHALFKELMANRRQPIFAAFDLLWLDGEDLCSQMLTERKRLLEKTIKRKPARALYVRHVEANGKALFKEVCARDLEGMVAKPAISFYRLVKGRSPWIKIPNPKYTQKKGRRELFEKRR
jgi:bifunctional non-homologous end joining protein LigD